MIARRPLALLVFPLAAACASSKAAPPEAPRSSEAAHDASPAPDIDGATAKKLVSEGATLVDVRSPAEYAEKHIDGAVNVPVDEVASHDFGDKNKPVIVYCHTGRRAVRARDALKSRGYTRAASLGGMSNWDNDGARPPAAASAGALISPPASPTNP